MDRSVSLPEILAARERRLARREAFFREAEGGRLLLQLTLNIPGDKKNSPLARAIFREASACVGESFSPAPVLLGSDEGSPTGPEAFFSLPGSSRQVKEACRRLEEEHPLGRLWDLDVYDRALRPLSRRDEGLPGRTCLICGSPAHACARSKRHPPGEILLRIAEIHRDFSTRNPPLGV